LFAIKLLVFQVQVRARVQLRKTEMRLSVSENQLRGENYINKNVYCVGLDN